MTDFEAATVAYQTASLAMQQAQMWSTYAQAGASLLVGGAQCLLIYLGLRMMSRANDHRDHLHAETMQQQTAAMRASERQHLATMRALEALIERTAPK